MDRIYFDNSATTAAYPEVVTIMEETLRRTYGNPSSMHTMGVESERYVREAAEKIAATLRVSAKEIIFTSGGTESDNLALLGGAAAMRRAGNRIVISAVEHPAVSETALQLEKQGFEVVRAGVDRNGMLRMDELAEVLTEDTILVSIMLVNNEVGSVSDPAAIGKLIRARCPKALYHCDAVQGYGKYRIYPRRDGIDLLSVSGHKIHGPKGVGFLYKRKDARILPILFGGGQQDGLRSGTDNVPGIAGLGCAAEKTYAEMDKTTEHEYRLKALMQSGLAALNDRLRGAGDGEDIIRLHGPEGKDGAPHIVNAAFSGIRSEVLLHAMEDEGIMISAGSACSSHKKNVSATLLAMGIPEEEAGSSVRFSFSGYNTEEEVDRALGALGRLLPVLRRYRAR